MQEQQFYKTINSVVENLSENTFGIEVLYDMCNDKLHPWGNKSQLRNKLCFISRLYNHPIHDGFLKVATYEVNGKQRTRLRHINEFESITDILFDNGMYKALVQKISDINWKFKYDASNEDIAHFKESLFAVLEFNDILKDAVCEFDELYDQQYTSNENIALASKVLHFHRPEQFFMFDREIYKGMINFRSKTGCRIEDKVIDNEAKRQIEATCRKVLKSMFDDGVLVDESLHSPKVDYIRSIGLQYAICCYIIENDDKIDGLKSYSLSLKSAAILSNIRRVKTREELDKILDELKPETPTSHAVLHFEDAVEFEQAFEKYRKNNNS